MSLLIYRSCKVQEQGGKGRKSGEKGTGGGVQELGGSDPPVPLTKKQIQILAEGKMYFQRLRGTNDWMTEWLCQRMNENFIIVQRYLVAFSEKKLKWHIYDFCLALWL